MFKAARQATIKEILLEQTQVDVQTLSRLLNVSVVTVRSDLEDLEREGFILRTHGGAILNDERDANQSHSPVGTDENISFSKEKKYIAQIAAQLIDENEWVFLGGGTTCYFIASLLLERPQINVVTNSLSIAALLAENPAANVIVTGGQLNNSKLFLSGDILERALSKLYISKAFLSVAGIDFNGGFTDSGAELPQVFDTIKKYSKDIIIVADYTKFDKVSFMKTADLKDVSTVISNEKIPAQYKEFFFSNGIKIYTSYKMNAYK